MKNIPSKSLNNMVSVYDYKKMIELQANEHEEKIKNNNIKVKKMVKEVKHDQRKRY